MNVLEERDKRTKYRKECKKVFDAKFDMSSDTPNGGPVYRLLDEGVVTYADGTPMMYLMKGTLSKALAKMSDDATGYINYGHKDFATDPLSLIGEWKKSDFILKDSGENDGRQVLDVIPHFFDENVYVQQLRRLNFTVGLSAEFYAQENFDLTEKLSEEIGEYVPVIQDIELLTFAVVGECGNVNSSDISLSVEGEDLMSIKELVAKFMAEQTPAEELSVEETPAEEVTEEEVTEEEVSEEAVEEEEETVEEETAEEDSVSEEDMEAFCQYLVDRISELETELENVRSQLSAQTSRHEAFMNKLKGLKLSVGNSEPNEDPQPENTSPYNGSDGIGE